MIGFLRPPEAARGLGGISGNLFAVDRDGLDVCGRLDRQRRRAALADVAAPLGREVLRLYGEPESMLISITGACATTSSSTTGSALFDALGSAL